MMKREDAMKVAEQELQELVQALEQGRSQVLEDYLTAVARLHKYSFRNLMLITSQCPEAVHVAGFYTWRTMDRTVKKGESGIAILAPLIRRASKEDRSVANIGARADAQETKTDDSSDPMGYRVVYVFDISQTEGKDFSPVTPIGKRPTNPFLSGSVASNPVFFGFRISPDEVVHKRVGAGVA